jgi:hypothetical protein
MMITPCVEFPWADKISIAGKSRAIFRMIPEYYERQAKASAAAMHKMKYKD